MAYNWNWSIFSSVVPTGDTTYLGWMLSGLQTTILLSLSAWLIALALGSLMGVLRTVPHKGLATLA
ncbi:MAG: amino acid ABC transporter permease, partial [Zoogloea sp.]|nr:amino acid ABC transporter permease [Zoogloea sp.]